MCILYVGLALLIESNLVSIVDVTVAKHLVSDSSMPTCNRKVMEPTTLGDGGCTLASVASSNWYD